MYRIIRVYTYRHICVCIYKSLSLSLAHVAIWKRRYSLLALLLVMIFSQKSDGVVVEEWCIADEQSPDRELQLALDWACGIGGANCSKIQLGQACFKPNTVRAHASYAFNNYYQKFKRRGGTCYFRGSAYTTALNPSYDSCNYELTP